MKKMYMLEDLDCANCAAKMEEAISKIDGVTYARVSYLAQKLTLEADDARYDDILAEVVKTCKPRRYCWHWCGSFSRWRASGSFWPTVCRISLSAGMSCGVLSARSCTVT